jgi:predicted nucleotidyltransferase
MEQIPAVPKEKIIPTANLELVVEEDNLKSLIKGLATQSVMEGKDIETTEKRRKTLLELALHLPDLSKLLLVEFRKLVEKEGFQINKMIVYLVGGRVRNEPIKDTSDFDLTISCDNELLNPLSRNINAINYSVRHGVIRVLNDVVRNFLTESGDLGIMKKRA